MSGELLFEVAPSLPRWKELQGDHGIYTHFSDAAPEEESWSAWYFGVLELSSDDIAAIDPCDLIDEYCCYLEEMSATTEGASEREAVIALLHQRQLEGWQEVAL